MSVRSALLLRRLVVLALLGVLARPAAAQSGELSSFPFLGLEPSARAAALSGSFSAVYGDDINGLFYNPALLNEQMHNALSFSYLNHLSDLNAGFAAYGRHVPDVGTFGAGLRFLSWGEIEEATEDGVRTGDTFGASDAALTVGFARAYADRLHYGANVHAIFSRVASYSASALAADLGVLYQIPSQQLTVSASINNLGVTTSSLGASRGELPLDLRVGLSKRLAHLPLLISITGYNLHHVGEDPDGANTLDDVMHFVTLGGEFQISNAFRLRFGYNHRRHNELKTEERLDLAGFGLGFGLKITRFRLDYAYNSWSSLGGLHHLTVRTTL